MCACVVLVVGCRLLLKATGVNGTEFEASHAHSFEELLIKNHRIKISLETLGRLLAFTYARVCILHIFIHSFINITNCITESVVVYGL